jgi:Fe-S-cluster containining protein
MTLAQEPLYEKMLQEAREVLERLGSNADPETFLVDLLGRERLDGADLLQTDSRGDVSPEFSAALIRAAYATRPYCVRCGACCASGSPTLTEEDEALFFKGVLRPSDVITLRKGEIAHSSVTQKTEPLTHEMIKIRERSGTRVCVFHDPEKSECRIYESRPVQCRAQKCWDPDAYAKTAAGKPLDRFRLLGSTGILWEIIARHEERCAHATFARTMARLGATKGRSVQDVLDLLAYDEHVRRFAVEKLGMAENELDFFFGRGLEESLGPYGLKVARQPDGSRILGPEAG